MAEKLNNDLLARIARIPCFGLILGVLSSFAFSCALMLGKFVRSTDPLYMVLGRSFLQLSIFLGVIAYQGLSFRDIKTKRSFVFILLCGIVGGITQVCAYASLRYISLADTTSILLSSPVFVSVFACLLLGEKCGPFQCGVVAIAIGGVLLICQPTYLFSGGASSTNIWGVLLALTGCLSHAFFYIFLRKLAEVHFAILNMSVAFSSGLLTVSAFMAGERKIASCGVDSMLVIANGLLSNAGMILFIAATKIEEAGPLSVSRTSEILFAFMWQAVLLHEKSSWASILGAIAICSSVVMIGFRKWFVQRRRKARAATAKKCNELNGDVDGTSI